MADLGEEAFSSQMKVVATFLRLLEELMRNKQQDLRYGTKTQRRGILGRMKDFVGGIFKKVYDGTFGRLSRNGKDYGQLDLNDPAVAKLFADTMKQMGMDAMHEDNNLLFSTSDVIVWLYTFMYAGNYRYGEEAGSAKWGTLKEGVAFKPELTIFTSKKRTFPQAFSVRKSVVQAVEKFLQKEKLYVKRDTNVPFSARPEKKALRTAKVHSYPRSILKAQFSMS